MGSSQAAWGPNQMLGSPGQRAHVLPHQWNPLCQSSTFAPWLPTLSFWEGTMMRFCCPGGSLLEGQGGPCQAGKPCGKVTEPQTASLPRPCRGCDWCGPSSDHRKAHRLTPMALPRVHSDIVLGLGSCETEEVMDWEDGGGWVRGVVPSYNSPMR